MDAKRPSVVISDSSALEFIFKRSRSWSRVVRKVLVINKTSSAIVHSYSFTEVGLLLTYSNLVQVPGVVVILCSMCVPVPATSAAVETVFSHGGLFMRPHRARLGHKVLSDLVFAKCNKHLK